MNARNASRVIVLDPHGRILLLRASNLNTPPQEMWELPGGGWKPGETAAQAARRELWEETGIAVEDVGACVARLDCEGRFADEPFRQREWLFVVDVEADTACEPRALEDDLERRSQLGYGWWHLADAVDAGLPLYPPQLARVAAPLLAERARRRIAQS